MRPFLIIGIVSDGGYQIIHSEMLKSMAPAVVNADPALWRIIYPKVFMVQAYAGSIISKGEFSNMSPFHPVLNLFFYILLLMTLMLIRFNEKEV